MKSSRLTISIYSILLIAVFGAGFVVVQRLDQEKQAVFSKRNMLDSLWYYYKKESLEADTLRALDKDRNNITTSEGQSYTMLRAVWVDDRATFDDAWQWTKDNMQRDEDHLISWLFGEREDGTYGILENLNGHNTASDADVDIALALLFASRRWNDKNYFGDAVEIIRDIWKKEVVVIGGRPYLAANNVEKFETRKNTIVVNPSYFTPYAYRIFAVVDPTNNWSGLIDSGYGLIEENSLLSLDTGTSAGIPSDWIAVNKATGKISAITKPTDQTTNYSYDALRLPWRLSLDRLWFNEPRAKKALASLEFFNQEWSDRALLYTNYSHAGDAVELKESPAMYGGSIGYFMNKDPDIARDVYYRKLESLYNVDTFNWEQKLGYYDSNWAWFGIALYNDLLPQLYPIQ